MILPAEAVTRAVLLTCGVCHETRFVNAEIRDYLDEDGERCVEVEIAERDHDVAARFGKIHLEPRALVCAR